jgi:hypothetical protein
MLSRRRRLRKLERSPLFQPPPDPWDEIVCLALQELSDEHFELLRGVVGKQEKGLSWTLSESEAAALEAYRAALEITSAASHNRATASERRQEECSLGV